MHKLAYL